MNTPTGPQPTHVIRTSEDTELALLELQLLATQSTHQYLGSGRFGLSKSQDGCKGGNTFTTFPRRRQFQRPLMTVWQDKGLLDEGQVHQTYRLLNGITSQWDFNAFHLDRLTGGHNLAFLCVHLFQVNNLFNYYRFDPLVVWKFFALVEKSYHATNPYHNAVHAADVTQAMSRFLEEPVFRSYIEPAEILGSIIAAVCHDLDHPGLNEKFLIATQSHLAGLYNNTSVLENHHWSMAVALMHESGLSACLSSSQHQEIVEIIRSLILATDISRQQEFITQLRYLLDRDEVNLSVPRCRHFILQIALKCADISNPCRSWKISRLWSYRACEEFFRQGDKERDLNLPVTPFCDRQNISVAKVQSTFYRYVAAPLFEEWHRLLDSPLSTIMTRNLTSNQARWDLLVQQECPASMAESVISQASTSSSSGGGSLHLDPPGGRDGLPPQFQRRFSRSSADDDDSDPCTSYPYMPLDDTASALLSRRHSLPFSISYLDEDLFPLGMQAASLHRQFSLGERRTRYPENVSSATASFHRTAHRRRVFAARLPAQDTPSVPCSLNSSMDGCDPTVIDNENSTRVSFYIGGDVVSGINLNDHRDSNSNRWTGKSLHGIKSASIECQVPEDLSFPRVKRLVCCQRSSLDSNVPSNCEQNRVTFNIQDYSDVDKENLNTLGRRRGSAPSHLLLNQMNRANSKYTEKLVTSRETSPNYQDYSCDFSDFGHRRGSLPSSLIFANQNHLNNSYTCNNCSNGCNTSNDPVKKRRHDNVNKNQWRQLGGSIDLLCEKLNGNYLNPGGNISRRPLRRGSFRSSSFGGVGTHRVCTNSEQANTVHPIAIVQENMCKKVSHGVKRRLKNSVKVNTEDTILRCDTRNFSQIQMMKNVAKNSAAGQTLKHPSYLNNGRRGSLPVEFTMLSCRV